MELADFLVGAWCVGSISLSVAVIIWLGKEID